MTPADNNPSAVVRFLNAYNATPSVLGERVARLLDRWLYGLHHMDDPSAVDWSDDYVILVKLKAKTLATFDFDELTRLVFLAHDHCLRVQVSGLRGPVGGIQLMFHGRQREGRMAQRHPTLPEAVHEYRQHNPLPLE